MGWTERFSLAESQADTPGEEFPWKVAGVNQLRKEGRERMKVSWPAGGGSTEEKPELTSKKAGYTHPAVEGRSKQRHVACGSVRPEKE